MNILITGASSGIGKVISKHLSEKGYTVYGTSRNPDNVDKLKGVHYLKLDITSNESIAEIKQYFIKNTIGIDVLINNAGTGICGAIEETSEDLARHQIETNFWGAVNLTKSFMMMMRLRREGKIIFISSLAGLIGVPYQGFYATSKHAIEGYAKSLRHELKEFNIWVSCIEPGFHKSNLHEQFQFAEAEFQDYEYSRDNAINAINKSIKSAPEPDRVARKVHSVIKKKKPSYSYRVGWDAKLLPIIRFINYRLFELGSRKKFGLK